MKKSQQIISIILKLAVTICVILGISLSFGSFMGESLFLYFTIQSNIWIGVLCLGCAVVQIVELALKKRIFPDWLHTVKLVFTVAITLTCVVFCAMIAPFMKNIWSAANILTHVVVPILAIADFFLFDRCGKHTYKKALFATIPPLYYLFFSLIGYFANWNFGGGKNYPYAFLNYGGSAGLFGFSLDTSDSLFFGSFYWIVFLVGFIIGLSCLYTLICKRLCRRFDSQSQPE